MGVMGFSNVRIELPYSALRLVATVLLEVGPSMSRSV